IYPFTSMFAGASGVRGRKIVRRAEALARQHEAGQPVIPLQWRRDGMNQEGSVHQRGQTLELSLLDLPEVLRGHYITIDVPLGSLIEPVRWRGGNPRAIRSAVRVAADGSLS